MKFKFKKIYIDTRALEDEITKNVLSYYAQVPCEIVQNEQNFLKDIQSFTKSEGKERLWLTHFKGNFLKPCPGTANSYRCCNYLVINESTNCPIDCSYCILQTYINSPVITIYTNFDQIIEELKLLSHSNPDRILRIGTGELTDSLALDPITGLSSKIIRKLDFFPNLFLELKSKTDHIDHLLREPHQRVVLSWSINPESLIKSEEHKSSNLKRRLTTARKAMNAGFLIGLHFDPIIYSADVFDAYTRLVEEIANHIEENRIAWISLGTLRFPPQLKPIIQERFSTSKILSGEQIEGLDGKIRYIKPLRLAMYKNVVNALQKILGDVFIYFCMESQDIWEQVLNLNPQNNLEVDWLFANSLYKRFPELHLAIPQKDIYDLPIKIS